MTLETCQTQKVTGGELVVPLITSRLFSSPTTPLIVATLEKRPAFLLPLGLFLKLRTCTVPFSVAKPPWSNSMAFTSLSTTSASEAEIIAHQCAFRHTYATWVPTPMNSSSTTFSTINPNAIFTPDSYFRRPSQRRNKITTSTFDTASSVKNGYRTIIPQTPAGLARPVFQGFKQPPLYLKPYFEDDPFEKPPQPFKNYIPLLMQQPMPYTNNALGHWNLPNYPPNVMPPIDLLTIKPNLEEISHSAHPSIVYRLRFRKANFQGQCLSIGQEVHFQATGSSTIGYFLMQLVSFDADNEGQYGCVLALCLRKDRSGQYYDCDTSCPPVEILVPLIHLGASILATHDGQSTSTSTIRQKCRNFGKYVCHRLKRFARHW